MTHTNKAFLAGTLALGFLLSARAQVVVTGMTKPQVSDLIRKVEDGVDEFEKYLERRGENAREGIAASGATADSVRNRASSRRSGRGRRTRETPLRAKPRLPEPPPQRTEPKSSKTPSKT